MKRFLEVLLYPLQMICEFIDGERDVLYKPKKEKLDMKIKLQEYSLISNEWIDEEINKAVETGETEGYVSGFVDALLMLKQQLIPSEKLADVCYDEGRLDYKKSINNKQDFLTSEIKLP